MEDKNELRKRRKRERNARDYLSSKSSRDHILLRLDKGGAARLDASSAAAGLSRAAFARLYLSPLVDALAPRLAAMETARASRRQSLAAFLGRALDAALANAPAPESESTATALEFDELFRPTPDGGS